MIERTGDQEDNSDHLDEADSCLTRSGIGIRPWVDCNYTSYFGLHVRYTFSGLTSSTLLRRPVGRGDNVQ